MAESNDGGEKTEAPTPRKKQEAREQGNLPKSTDLSAAVLLLATLLLLYITGAGLMTALRDLMSHVLGVNGLAGDETSHDLAVRAVITTAWALAPFLLGAMLVAILINIAQVGLLLTPKKLKPNFGLLNPLKGVNRLFGGERGFVQLLMGFAKMAIVGFVAYTAVHAKLEEIVLIQSLEFFDIFALASSLLLDVGLRLGAALLVLALIDYVYQRWKTNRDLKMTKQEVKEEMKRMEGDPMIRQRRRQIALQRAMQRVNAAVPDADVVVTNPTHYAVALKYDEATMRAPKVVAKGVDFIALRIREVAAANGVTVVERPPLARTLYAAVEVGHEVPEELWAAVAEILAYVYEVNRETAAT